MRNKTMIVVLALAVAAVCGGCEQEFAVKRVSPMSGAISGGEAVDIIGSGFQPGMGLTVFFGTARAEKVVVRGKDTITVNTPTSSEARFVDVRVVTDDGREYVLREAFRYVTNTSLDIRDMGQLKSLRDSE